MRLFFIICLLLVTVSQLHAQTAEQYDREKLLELYQSQRYAEAGEYLRSMYPNGTKDVKVLNQIAYCFMMGGQLAEAEESYSKILEQQENSLPVLFNLGNINLRRGNNTKAKSYYERIVVLDSTNFNAFKKLADMYVSDLDSQKVVYLTKANKLNPIDADVAFDLARVYRKTKDYELAYNTLSIAIKADTGNLILQQEKLPVAIQLQKYKEVIETGEKLLTGGADAKTIKEVGLAYYYLKNYQKAISYFKMLETVDAQNESSLYYTSLCYRALNDLKSAATYGKKAIDEAISPNTTSYYLLLGGIYELDKQYVSANTAYKRGLTFKENGNIYYRLAILNDFNFKQPKTALNYYRLYLKTKPDIELDKDQISYSKERIAALSVNK
ncbi:MAG: tetratricopeptide repeat protein [Pedobacter sp.]|nr:MAG: tetratricopeptide repeat protein [Pedobacter sp.]